MSDELLKQARVLIDYTDPEAVARQNIPPNAACVIDGTVYDVRNLVHLASSQADRIEALTARAEKAVEALKEAVSQLRKVHDDAFKQAAGHGLMTADGRSFSCFQINRCQEVAGECERTIATTTKENSHE
jgi:hypothetical protein